MSWSASITKWAAWISGERFDLESPNFTRTSAPTHFTATPDMTSLLYFGLKIILEKTSQEGFKVRITWFYTLIGGSRPHKPAGYDVTSYFPSAFIDVRKRSKVLPLLWILVVLRFAWPNQLVCFLLCVTPSNTNSVDQLMNTFCNNTLNLLVGRHEILMSAIEWHMVPWFGHVCALKNYSFTLRPQTCAPVFSRPNVICRGIA